MNISQYISKKYSGKPIRILSYHEAVTFGVPYPLRGGWYKEFGPREITDAMREAIVKKLRGVASGSIKDKKIDAASAGLAAFGEGAPPNKTQQKYIKKKSSGKNRQTPVAVVDKPLKRPRQPTESTVKSFVSHSGVNPVSNEFLYSFEWRAVRMMALRKYGPVCQCCGASPMTGAVMHVDHIKPRKIFPQLALNVDNLQVLCAECNHGKGNWDMTDWRTKTASLQHIN